MRSIPPPCAVQISDAVRHMAMPLAVKERILDQVLGYHDDLHRPARKRQERTPMAERVAALRKRAAFTFLCTEADGVDVWELRLLPTRADWDAAFADARVRNLSDKALCQRLRALLRGVVRYQLRTRDGEFLSCACPNFDWTHRSDPAYACKHGLLWLEMEHGAVKMEHGAVNEKDTSEATEYDLLERMVAHPYTLEWNGEDTVTFHNPKQTEPRDVQAVFVDGAFLWVHSYPNAPFTTAQYEAAAVLWAERRGLCAPATQKEAA